MSAIFGLVCLDGRPVPPGHVQAMGKSHGRLGT